MKKKNMDIKNVRHVKYYEVPLDDGKFALMDQNDFDKFTVGKPTDAIARASGLIKYVLFEMDDKNYAIPESKFEAYIKKLNEDAKNI
jgi:translation elongation factor P/translation initiation factor 5A